MENGQKRLFDYAYITIHGTPGENGKMQGYFDPIGLPYSTSSLLVEAMTFDKFVLNNYLRGFGVSVADSLLISKGYEEVVDRLSTELKTETYKQNIKDGMKHNVRGVPAIVIEDDGGEVIYESVGNLPYDDVLKGIREVIDE
jgi:D-alanine-D-alanine ligase